MLEDTLMVVNSVASVMNPTDYCFQAMKESHADEAGIWRASIHETKEKLAVLESQKLKGNQRVV